MTKMKNEKKREGTHAKDNNTLVCALEWMLLLCECTCVINL
jgi:hypothetical protein